MIYCVEDDESIRDIEVYALRATGMEAEGFADGASFLAALEKRTPDLAVLDVMLPGMDGLEILRRIRADAAAAALPVIMATARGAEYDKIQGLDGGADYYLTKPFGVMEFVSCVKAVLRRCGQRAPAQETLTAGALEVRPGERTVTVEGRRVALTYKEFELLLLLMRSPGMVFTREQLMTRVWGTDYLGESRTVDMHVRTLRQKLGVGGGMIETVRNVGYRMEKET